MRALIFRDNETWHRVMLRNALDQMSANPTIYTYARTYVSWQDSSQTTV